MNQMIPSFVFRRRAWKAIKPLLQVLIIIGLLAVLPGYVEQAVVSLTDASPNEYLEGPSADIMDFVMQEVPEDLSAQKQAELLEEGNALLEAYMAATDAFLQEKGAIYFSMVAMGTLLTPIMMAPLYSCLLDALRGKPLTLPAALGKFRYGLRALLLYLWMTLRIWVWTLPGMAVMLAGMLIPMGGLTLMFVGMVIALVLGVRAGLHYSLAPIALVDNPGVSLNGCIRISWQVMRTRKMEYFMLLISFAIWHLLITMLTFLQVSVVMVAISLTLKMMAEMLLTVYISGAEAAFYEAYAVKGETHCDVQAEFARDEENPSDDLL